MREFGRDALHNRHVVDGRADRRRWRRRPYRCRPCGHHADHAAPRGRRPHTAGAAVVHQPKQIEAPVAHGVDLQISGHTHGARSGRLLRVRLDQPVVPASAGMANGPSSTLPGTGFGTTVVTFAPSEITLLTSRGRRPSRNAVSTTTCDHSSWRAGNSRPASPIRDGPEDVAAKNKLTWTAR